VAVVPVAQDRCVFRGLRVVVSSLMVQHCGNVPARGGWNPAHDDRKRTAVKSLGVVFRGCA
jgi:hypothetical protein